MGKQKDKAASEAAAKPGEAEITIGAPPEQDEKPEERDLPEQDDKPESYVMGHGNALCGTKKGLIGQGQEVRPDYLRDGQKGFDGWVETGHIVTSAEYEAQVKAAKAKKAKKAKK